LYTAAAALQGVGAYHLDILPYLVLSQLKLVLTPVFGMLLLKLCFDRHQWACLLSMACGMILVQSGTITSTDHNQVKEKNMAHGAIAMVIAGGCVAFSGVFMEMMLKTSPHHLVHNAHLAAYSCVFALAGYLWRAGFQPGSFFQGYHGLVWLFVFLNALGGFLVAWCIRITSTIGKNYAQGFGFVLASTIPLLAQSRRNSTQVRSFDGLLRFR
ncbi:nucleotide-sugar transporter, partial [Stachybotrys elegans]